MCINRLKVFYCYKWNKHICFRNWNHIDLLLLLRFSKHKSRIYLDRFVCLWDSIQQNSTHILLLLIVDTTTYIYKNTYKWLMRSDWSFKLIVSSISKAIDLNAIKLPHICGNVSFLIRFVFICVSFSFAYTIVFFFFLRRNKGIWCLRRNTGRHTQRMRKIGRQKCNSR